MLRLVLGFLLGFLILPAVLMWWLKNNNVPVAVADPALPFEGKIADKFLHKRMDREVVKVPPIQADEPTLVAGAEIYRDHCAVCHGFHGKPSAVGERMYPTAPPLWEKDPDKDAIGVSDDLPGATWWKVSNGIRLTGMPSFKGVLDETAMWQVSLLLAGADKPLPPAAVEMLRGNLPTAGAENDPSAGTKPLKTAPKKATRATGGQ